MEDTQTRQLNMGITSFNGLNGEDFGPIVAASTLATAKRNALEQNIEDIEAADAAQQASSGGGEFLTKEEYKHTLADETDIIAQAICLRALDENNHVLYQLMNFHAPAIFKMKDTDAVAFSNLVLETVTADPAGYLDYNVTGTMITALGVTIGKFETAEAAPQTAKGQLHTATTNVSLGIVAMLKTLLWFDHWVGTFRTSNHNFYTAYHSWRRVLNTGVRHVSVRGLVKGSVGDIPLPKVKITILETGAVLHSGKTGKFRAMSLETAVYTFIFELPGYQKFTASNVAFVQGTITNLNVTLVKN